jgi:ABC-2 type transport system ATP-binding protein
LAVAGVDVTVHSRERVALLGPNGAGKTTTLTMLLGV